MALASEPKTDILQTEATARSAYKIWKFRIPPYSQGYNTLDITASILLSSAGAEEAM